MVFRKKQCINSLSWWQQKPIQEVKRARESAAVRLAEASLMGRLPTFSLYNEAHTPLPPSMAPMLQRRLSIGLVLITAVLQQD